jgi:hypothetical protein
VSRRLLSLYSRPVAKEAGPNRPPGFSLEGFGAIAQLGERFNGIEEVVGSIPSGSTNKINTLRLGAFRPVGRREPQGDRAEEFHGKKYAYPDSAERIGVDVGAGNACRRNSHAGRRNADFSSALKKPASSVERAEANGPLRPNSPPRSGVNIHGFVFGHTSICIATWKGRRDETLCDPLCACC